MIYSRNADISNIIWCIAIRWNTGDGDGYTFFAPSNSAISYSRPADVLDPYYNDEFRLKALLNHFTHRVVKNSDFVDGLNVTMVNNSTVQLNQSSGNFKLNIKCTIIFIPFWPGLFRWNFTSWSRRCRSSHSLGNQGHRLHHQRGLCQWWRRVQSNFQYASEVQSVGDTLRRGGRPSRFAVGNTRSIGWWRRCLLHPRLFDRLGRPTEKRSSKW